MPAQGAEPRSERAKARADACRVLQVAPTADAEIVTQAYWHLARKYRADASTDRDSREHLDKLNDAYRLLQPKPEAPPQASKAPGAQQARSADPQASLAEELTTWLRGVIEQTRERWKGHVQEIGVLTATTTLLAFLALSAGANPLWTVFVATVAAITIWAPWRRA